MKNNINNKLTDPELELVRKLQQQDTEAYKILIDRYKEKVRSLVYSMTNNITTVNDISQDVFVKIWYAAGGFKEQSKFSTWVYQITLNKVKDHLRKKKVMSFINPFQEDAGSDIMTKDIEREELTAILQKEISGLPAKQREIIILKDINDYSYEEISEILKCSIGTVKSRLFRAREMLKERMEKYEGELR